LDRARIAAAAVALIDRDGLERFGVRRLAEALGVDPMSIYHHIKGKAALLDAASEAVLAEVADTLEAGGDGGGDWEELARRIARAYREVAFRHPHVVPLLATRPQVSPVALSALERLVAAMRAAGLPDRVIADVPLTLFGFLNGYLLAVVGGDPGGEPGVPPIDADRYPAMASVAPLLTGFGSAAEFERLLDTLVAGIVDRARR